MTLPRRRYDMQHLPGFFDSGAYFSWVHISRLIIPDLSMRNATLLNFIFEKFSYVLKVLYYNRFSSEIKELYYNNTPDKFKPLTGG